MPARENFDINSTAPRTFPLPGSTYYQMLYDPKAKKQFYTIFKIFNAIAAPLYRLGLLPRLGFRKLALLLTDVR